MLLFNSQKNLPFSRKVIYFLSILYHSLISYAVITTQLTKIDILLLVVLFICGCKNKTIYSKNSFFQKIPIHSLTTYSFSLLFQVSESPQYCFLTMK